MSLRLRTDENQPFFSPDTMLIACRWFWQAPPQPCPRFGDGEVAPMRVTERHAPHLRATFTVPSNHFGTPVPLVGCSGF
jgi:hypothetical protein